jgi:preprotein translocase subunit SecA
MAFLDKILGDPNVKVIKTLQPIIDEINSLEEEVSKFKETDFKNKTEEFKQELKGLTGDDLQKKLDEKLPLAFALVREAAKQTLGQRHYDVQLIGGIVLHRGQIAEMKTGEGKTLVATLPLYLNALAGKGAQLITVNDYLSRIGAGWMAPVYHILGLTTGVIMHDSAFQYDPEYTDETQYDERLKYFRPVPRKEAYACDITYGTNNEFGFDYLRDNMAPDLERVVQREHYFVIVDEVDSILIDEARTPLIISAPAEESTDKYYKFAALVRRLKENEDYNIDEKMRAATLSEGGIAKMEKWLGVENIYTAGGVREVHHIEQALKAYTLFKRDRDYIVKEGEVIIVDEFTGRLMYGRRYSDGLHQAIEAKEGAKIQRESQTLATVTFQNYFRMYEKLAGMTGTAITEAEEFAKIYNLETSAIPTHKPLQRIDMNDLIYRSEEGKFKAVIADIKKRNEKGQPILIGTISIEKNELLAEMMEREGLKPQVLNAKQHEKEARIITEAGKVGAITIATNMAGRGVDIMLGGKQPAATDPGFKEWKKEHDRVIELGGLHVIGTERHESRRIDNQLRGRSGRQGDPGSSQFYVSTEDDLMRIFGGDRMKNMMATLRVPEDMPIENKIISKSIESAQTKVEGNNFDIRKHLVEYDDVINKHREAIYRKRKKILLLATGRETSEKSNSDSQISATESNSNVNTNEIDNGSLRGIILENIENEIEQVVSFHTAAEQINEWNLDEIYQVVATIFPVDQELKTNLVEYSKDNHKLDKAKARTKIIDSLNGLAQKKYEKIVTRAEEKNINWQAVEKAVLIRSIDTLWVEHLEAMSSLRQGIGLRGYGQRDPLVEYKKEAYHLFNQLQSLIQKEVVYSIFKIGAMHEMPVEEFKAPSLAERARQFSAPAKVMDSSTSSFSSFKQADPESAAPSSGGKPTADKNQVSAVRTKPRDASGKKVGRNDPCPCGSGKKYKKCHGA